jgi:hypothetical protein
MDASTIVKYIFIAPNCTTTIISLEPCPLNVEFHLFTLNCNISYLDLIKCLYFANQPFFIGEKIAKKRSEKMTNKIYQRKKKLPYIVNNITLNSRTTW